MSKGRGAALGRASKTAFQLAVAPAMRRCIVACGALMLAASLVGCAASRIPPVAIPRGEPVVFKFDLAKVEFSAVDMSAFVSGGALQTTIADTTTTRNRRNTAELAASLASRERELAALFESELRARFIAKGGKLQDAASARTVTIFIDHLGVGYHARSFASAYAPIAYVRVHASTDPPSVGDRAGATVRSVDVHLDASVHGSFSAQGFMGDPQKTYGGLRAAVIALAERVATSLVAAQSGTMGR